MGRKIAVFDIDGTLFRWQLFHELVAELGRQGLFPDGVASKVEEKFFAWRALQATWADYEAAVVDAIQKYIAIIPPEKLDECAKLVIEKSGHKVYNYTSNLVKKLKTKGYYLLALTGSQQEIAEIFAKKHGFNDCLGSLIARDEKGNFTSNYERFVIGNKAEILINYCQANGFDLQNDSYAVGDSYGDEQMLALAKHPIAFNPDELLLKAAITNSWKVVIERKNIAYELEAAEGRVFLKKTEVF
jgi:HAD superfamily phosphoserine phosphatase-like hydrolase